MLFLLRQLRRLELRKRSGRYFVYAFGEIVLIVVGILLALQVSEWNQARKDRLEEQSILVRLKAEFVENQKRLEERKNHYTEIAGAMRNFLKILKPEPEEHPDELIHEYMTLLDWAPSYTPNAAVIDPLIASGRITLIRNESLSHKLSSWPRALSVVERNTDYLLQSLLLNMDHLSEFHHYKNIRWIVDKEKGHPGASHFPYDQKRLLSSPKIESIVARARVDAESSVVRIDTLIQLQQEILDLIEQELSNR